MKLRKLKEIIDSLCSDALDSEVAVKICGVYATEPHVNVTSAYLGFDWSAGIFMLIPEKELNVKK